MPFSGKCYDAGELQEILGIGKQAVSNLASYHGWTGPKRGTYWAECVEPLLDYRNIDPDTLLVRTYDFQDGATEDDIFKASSI